MQKFGQVLFPGICDCYQTHQIAYRIIKILNTTGQLLDHRSGIYLSPSMYGALFPVFTGFELCIK